MREEGHIGLRQGVILLYAILTAKLFIQSPAFLIGTAGPAAWQAALVMTLTALLLFLPMAALVRRFPGQGLAEISDTVAGPFFGSLLTLAVAAWLMLTLVVSVRNFTETFIISILPHTPPSVIGVVAVLCVMYASYRGLEPVTRATQVLFPLILGGTLMLIALSLPRAEVSKLYPFWGYGIGQTVFSGAWYSSMASETIILLTVGYCFRADKSFQRAGVLGIGLFGLTMALTAATLVMIFGAPDAAQQPFPMYMMARLVYFGRFLQRTESIIVMFWFFAAIVRLTALFHGTVVSLTGALRLPFYRPLIFPVAVLAVAMSLLPQDFTSILRLDRDWNRPLGLIVMGIPILLLVIALIRGKGGQQTHATEA